MHELFLNSDELAYDEDVPELVNTGGVSAQKLKSFGTELANCKEIFFYEIESCSFISSIVFNGLQ